MEESERKELCEKVNNAYEKFHAKNLRELKYSKNKSNYKNTPFFLQLSEDIFLISEYENKRKTSVGWLLNFFFHKGKKNFKIELIKTVKSYCDVVDRIVAERKKRDQTQPVEQKITKIEFLISQYKLCLSKKLKTIRLNIIDFEIDINQIIKLHLRRVDTKKQSKLFKLKENLKKLKQLDSNDKISIKSLRGEIETLEQVLKKNYDILELINSDKDLFIHSPAGYGKSTLLQWLCYGFSKNIFNPAHEFIPIFIELKHFIDTTLKELIEKNIVFIDFSTLKLPQHKVLLLIDGFDEYKGDSALLIEQIIDFKKETNAKIVFSGRTVPKFKNKGLDFKVFTLNQMKEEQINEIFISVLGKENGQIYFEKLSQKGLLVHLRVPLFLILLLNYLDQKIKENIEVQEITKLILNKGFFLETILVNEFVFDYEKERLETNDKNLKKHILIDLISYIAFYLTIECYNDEFIERVDLEIILVKYVNNHYPNEKISVKKSVDRFIYYHFLEQFDTIIGFEKKEIRLFFTARHLSKIISSADDFESLKTNFNKFFNVKCHDSWWHIEQYFFGIVQGDKLIDKNHLIFINDRLLLTDASLKQLLYLLELVDKRNTDRIPYDKNSVKNILMDIILTYLNRKVSVKNVSVIKILINKLTRTFILNFKSIRKNISADRVDDLNNQIFVHFPSYNYPLKNMDQLYRALALYDLGMTFRELIKFLSDNDKDYFYNSFAFVSLIGDTPKDNTSESSMAYLYRRVSPLLLSKTERLNFAFDYIFRRRYFSGFGLRANISLDIDSRCLIKKTLENYSSDFLKIFYAEYPNPRLIHYARLYDFVQKNKWDCLTLDSGKLSENIQEHLIQAICETRFLKKNRINFELFLVHFIKNNVDKKIQIDIINKLFNLISDNSAEYISRIESAKLIFCLNNESFNDRLKFLYINSAENLREIIIRGALFLKLIMSTVYTSIRYYGLPEFYLLHLKSGSSSAHMINLILKHCQITSDEFNEEALNLAKMNTNGYYIKDLINFFGRFKLEKSIPFLLKELKGKYDNLAYYSLTQIDSKYFYEFEENFTLSRIINQLHMSSIIYKYNTEEQKDVLRNALYLGDSDSFDLYEKIEHQNLPKEVKSTYISLKYHFKRKMYFLDEFDKKKPSH